MQEGEIQLEQLVKSFGDVVAVDGIDVNMPPGEFFTMVGPSGCGKTTTLRMIAGFERPTSGRILLDGVDVAQTPPHRRNVNTVFQSYALFPHLNVADNVAFGLKYKQVAKGERGKMVGEALALVQLSGYERRKPGQLSGGQQQRVALARALVLRPRVLLLDEPLGALDARLRKDLQVELKTLQQSLGITFVFVTHDQEEALTMSDRVAVMNDGRVEQSGPPQEMYEEPATLFVADFLGVSNLVPAEASGREGVSCMLRVGEVAMRAVQGTVDARGPVKAMIRPERVRIEPQGTTGENRLPGLVEHLVFLGSFREVRVRLLGGALVTAVQANDGDAPAYEQGSSVSVHLPAESLRVLPEAPEPEEVDEEAAEAAEAESEQAPPSAGEGAPTS
jgi:spermidine/putrescine transport system ATP-binding protein